MAWKSDKPSAVALDSTTLARRIQAARNLSGLKQAELDTLVEEDVGRKDLTGRLERYLTSPERSLPPFTTELAESIARHTCLPVAWFMEPEIGLAFAADRAVGERLRRLESRLAEVAGLAAQHESRLQELLRGTQAQDGELASE